MYVFMYLMKYQTNQVYYELARIILAITLIIITEAILL